MLRSAVCGLSLVTAHACRLLCRVRYRLQAGASASLVGTYLVALMLSASGGDASVSGGARTSVAWAGVVINIGFAAWWVYEVALRKRARRLCRRCGERADAQRRRRAAQRRQRREAERLRKKAIAAAMPESFGPAGKGRFDNSALEMAVTSAPNPMSRWEREWAMQEQGDDVAGAPGAAAAPARASGTGAGKRADASPAAATGVTHRHNPLLLRS